MKATPVFIVATAPFTTIGFDENDKLETSFDHINNNSYDYVKFCRTTLAIDAEFEKPVPAVVSYTSCFLFPIIKGMTRKTCVDAVNRVIFRLLFGGISFNAAKLNDVGIGYLNHTGYFRFNAPGLGDNVNFIHALQNRMSGQDRNARIFNPRFFTKEELENKYWQGRINTSKITPVNPSLLANGFTDLEDHDYESSIVFTWTFIEQLLSIIWNNEIIAKAKPIFKRKGFLQSRSWNAASRTELLYQKNLLTDEIYEELNHARDQRNQLIHSGSQPTFAACKKALKAAIKIASLIQTNYKSDGLFREVVSLIESHNDIDKPIPKIIKDPVMWRKIYHIPGDSEWGDKPYVRHEQIELRPMIEVLAEGVETSKKS